MSDAVSADLETLATEQIDSLVPEEIDGLTSSTSFRQATAKLLSGAITVPEWEWHFKQQLNRSIDVPYVGDAAEKGIFDTAISTVGTAIQGLFTGGSGMFDEVTNDDEFRSATLSLLNGTATVPEWVDVAGVTLDALIDVPYVPAWGEDILFDRGLDLIASALHGLFVGGSENAA